MKDHFNFAIAAPWPKSGGSLCVYAYGAEVHFGSLKEAEKMLAFVQTTEAARDEQYDHQPKPEDFQIYKLVPLKG